MDTAQSSLPKSSSSPSEADKLSAKRPSLPSSSDADKHSDERPTLPPSRKVCLICDCASEESDDAYHIFIVDLNHEVDTAIDEFISRAPTLRVDHSFFYAGTFCVLNSRLYMFEGYDRAANRWGKSVFAFELSSDVPTNLNLKLVRDHPKLKQVAGMLQPKFGPSAIPTPGGKIVVFPSVIEFNRYASPANRYASPAKRIDFELYDPTADSWKPLPGICDDWKDRPSVAFWIEGYTFLTESILFVQTEVGLFTLDIESGNGWENWNTFAGINRIPIDDGHILTIGGKLFCENERKLGSELCLTPCRAYDTEKQGGFHSPLYFPSSFSFPKFSQLSGAITFLDKVDNEKCEICITQTGLEEETEYPHLVVDLYRWNLVKYRENRGDAGRAALGTSVVKVKSLKFRLDSQQCPWFSSLDLFSF